MTLNRSYIAVIAGLILTLVCSTGTKAQDYDSFYRGVNVSRYDFRYNGTPYWYSPAFQKANIFYDGKLYENIATNIDAHKQSVEIIREHDALPMSLRNDKVAWIKLKDSLYVNLHYFGYADAPDGFFKVVTDTRDMLLVQVRKVISNNSHDANGKTIGYYDPKYNPKLLTCFSIKSNCYLFKDGRVYKINNRRSFLKLYPERESDLKKAVHMYPRPGLQQWCEIMLNSMEQEHISVLDVLQPNPYMKRTPAKEIPEYKDNLPTSSLATRTDPLRHLPEGWFTIQKQEEEGGVVKYVSGARVKAIFQNKVYELGDKTKPARGKVKIDGIVYDSSTEEPMIGVIIFDSKTENYTYTDKNGHYSLELPIGENVINFSEPTMEDFHAMVEVYDRAHLDVEMNEESLMLESAMVSAESRANHRTTKMGLEKMSARTIKKMPTAFGEADVLKAVQSLPGVKSVGEASGGINVRGGSSDQNLILYNGSTIYNPSHMFGLFSTFNPDIVDGIELYKSSVPVEFGGRISSVLDVKGKEGDPDKFGGSLGLGILTSHLFLEGPVTKSKKTSFVLGGRTTYSDWLLGLLPEDSGYANGTASFNDINLGVTHKFNEDNVLKADVYWSRDKFAFTADTTFRYSNFNASVRFRSNLNDKTQLNVSASFDRYGSTLDDFGSPSYEYLLETGIDQASFRAAFRTKAGEHSLSYGVEAVAYDLNPGEMTPTTDTSLVVAHAMAHEYAVQPAAWFGDTWYINSGLSVEYGARAAGFWCPSGKLQVYPEGRISAKYTFNPDLSVKAGFNNMTQFIHLISNTSSISPIDTWKLCDERIKPQQGWQAAAGAYYTAFDGKVDFSLEVYWKRMYNYLDYKSGATLVMNENLADDLVTTTGKAYGVELMAKKTTGKLTGWVSYTYSRTLLREMENRGLATINQGNWYNAPFDKPHDVKVVGNYSFTHRYSLSFNLDYSTGRPVTIPVGKYYYADAYRLAYSDRNAYRIPDYFRLDLAMNVEPGHYLRQLTHFSVTFGIYNVTGRHNAYSVFYKTDKMLTKGYMLSVFAVPIPYLTLNMKF